MILIARSSFYLKNSCRNIYKLLSQPNRSSGLSFSIFLRRSLTVLLKDFFSKLMDLLFISEMVSGVTPSQGLLPTSSSQKSKPRQQMSTLLLQPSLRMTSGARYSQLPQSSFIFSPGSILMVNPKSQIFTSPFSFSSTFSGLRSRQTRPFSCRLTTPNATCIQIRYFSVRVRRLVSSAFLLLRITPQRSPCAQYSMTKQTYRESSNWQYNLTLYLLGNSRTSYSELIMASEPLSRHSALLMRFMQKTRRSHRRQTRKISAQVPSPILRRIAKWPSVTDSAWQPSAHSGSGRTTSRLSGRRTNRFRRPGSSGEIWSSSKQSSQSLARRTSRQKLRGLVVRRVHSSSCGGSLPVATRCCIMEVRERVASWVTLIGLLSLGISSPTLKQGFISVKIIWFEYKAQQYA